MGRWPSRAGDEECCHSSLSKLCLWWRRNAAPVPAVGRFNQRHAAVTGRVEGMSVWDRLPAHRLLVDVSLWSADLTALGDEVRRLEPYADMLHVDVTDARFVPGLLFFPDLVAAVRPLTQTPIHVHLMVDDPLTLIDDFVDAGADALTVHCESPQAAEAIERIGLHGRAPGVAIGLDTSVGEAADFLPRVEHVLLMGTPLGVKGVNLDPTACQRVRTLRQQIHASGLSAHVRIVADGGLRRHTVPALRAAGVDLITPGSLIFGSPSLDEVFSWLWSLPGPDRNT